MNRTGYGLGENMASFARAEGTLTRAKQGQVSKDLQQANNKTTEARYANAFKADINEEYKFTNHISADLPDARRRRVKN